MDELCDKDCKEQSGKAIDDLQLRTQESQEKILSIQNAFKRLETHQNSMHSAAILQQNSFKNQGDDKDMKQQFLKANTIFHGNQNQLVMKKYYSSNTQEN